MVVEATTVTYFNDRNIEILEEHNPCLLQLDTHYIPLRAFARQIFHLSVEGLGRHAHLIGNLGDCNRLMIHHLRDGEDEFLEESFVLLRQIFHIFFGFRFGFLFSRRRRRATCFIELRHDGTQQFVGLALAASEPDERAEDTEDRAHGNRNSNTGEAVVSAGELLLLFLQSRGSL